MYRTKLTLILFATMALCVVSAHAQITCTTGQSPVWTANGWTCQSPASQPLPTGTAVNMTIANDTVTGTTVNRLAKLSGAPSKAIITATTDTDGALGVVTAGAGTSGNATIAIIGQVTCDFDNATTAGDYVTISAITTGKCHDAGSAYPTGGANYGRVLSTNGASGAFVMELMTPDVAFQNAGNGKSRPGGSNLDYQYNNSNQFGGAGLKQETANVVGLRNGTTAQEFNLYKTFTDASNYERLRLYIASNAFQISSEASGTGTQRAIVMQLPGTIGYQLDGTGLFPLNDNTYVLGKAGALWATVSTTNLGVNSTVTVNSGGSASVKIDSSAAGTLRLRDSANSATAPIFQSGMYATGANCSDNAGAAACGAAAAGSVVIDAGSTSVVVSTSAVTANSQIFAQFDSSLGTRLGITCNTTPAIPAITARTAGTSFTITIPVAPVTNPACYSYFIVN